MAKQLPKTAPEKYFDHMVEKWKALPLAFDVLDQDDAPFPEIPECASLALDVMQLAGIPKEKVLDELHAAEKTLDLLLPEDLALLARWKNCKHLFRFDATLAEELMEQDIPEEIPSTALSMLPYPIVFIEAPVIIPSHNVIIADSEDGSKTIVGIEQASRPAKGFFAYISPTADRSGVVRDSLVIHYLDPSEKDSLVPIYLNSETIGGLICTLMADDEATFGDEFDKEAKAAYEKDARSGLAQVINLLLYIGAENADLETIYKPSGLSKKVKVSQAEIHSVGARIGAELRAARIVYTGGDSEESRGAKAPHIRRGHYHSYWTGPKSGEQELKVKWLSPIAVNAGKDAGVEKEVAVHKASAKEE